MILTAVICLAAAQASKVTLHVGDPAPALAVTRWAKGKPVERLGGGKIAIVEFGATWCVPCRESIPHLARLAKKYSGRVDIVGIDTFEHLDSDEACITRVSQFVKDQSSKMDYHVAIDDHDDTMGKAWVRAAGQPGIPTAFVIGKDGVVLWIGHPMNIDKVIELVVDGKFDPKTEPAREKQELADKIEAQKKMVAPLDAALRANDYKTAIRVADKISAQDPSFKAGYDIAKVAWISTFDDRGAMKYAASIAAGEIKDNSEALNELAWSMVADNSQVKNPDYLLAVKIAEQAVKLSNDDPMNMDTLAMAYYRAKRTVEAIAMENKAIDKAKSTAGYPAEILTGFYKQLDLFKVGTPTR